ncbi:MAG: acyltransferase [Pseudomonadota bacterium]
MKTDQGNPERTNRLEILHLLRALGCIYVILFHYYGYLTLPGAMAPYARIEPPLLTGYVFFAPVLKTLSYLKINSYTGISLFFLISGFVIPISISRMSIPRFLYGRVLRIYPLVIIALFLITVFGYMAGGSFGLFTGSEIVKAGTLFRDFMWSPYVENAFWTLEVEIKFYIVCSLLAAAPVRFLTKPWAAIGLTAAFLAFFLVWAGAKDQIFNTDLELYKIIYTLESLFPFLTYMFFGTVVYHVHKKSISRSTGWLVGAILAISFSVMSWLSWNPTLTSTGFIASYNVALSLFLIAYSLRHRVKSNRVLNFYADISYPLYLVHATIGFYIMIMAANISTNVNVIFFITFTSVTALAYLLHHCVELPCQRLKKKTLYTKAAEPSGVKTFP